LFCTDTAAGGEDGWQCLRALCWPVLPGMRWCGLLRAVMYYALLPPAARTSLSASLRWTLLLSPGKRLFCSRSGADTYAFCATSARWTLSVPLFRFSAWVQGACLRGTTMRNYHRGFCSRGVRLVHILGGYGGLARAFVAERSFAVRGGVPLPAPRLLACSSRRAVPPAMTAWHLPLPVLPYTEKAKDAFGALLCEITFAR